MHLIKPFIRSVSKMGKVSVLNKNMKCSFSSVYHKERAKMWRRPILPLTEDEMDNHLFRIPDDPVRFPVLPDVFPSPKPMERSKSQPQMGTDTAGEKIVTEKSARVTFNDTAGKMATDSTGMISSQPMPMQETQQPIPMAS